ncbi:MAG: tripartite tricarboxylate transporter substrate binding protein [Clostridiaceae bacterium]|nr:tripartite tricarboxylate transporter substrate binding protein [Clostridiaceae bacterium]
MKKKVCALLVAFMLVVSILTGCGEDKGLKVSDQKSDYPNKPINLIVPFAPGGGMDVAARVLSPFLEKELGVTVNILNKPGASGWVGWTELMNSAPDGYTIASLASPSIIPGYLDPQFKRDKGLEAFDLIANQVFDVGAFAINPEDKRFTNAKELIEYAQKNEVTCGQDGVGSDDWMALSQFNKLYNTKFTSVATKSTAESLAGVMGKNMDVVFANLGELKVPHDNKDITIVAIMDKERSKFLPDIPTAKELGFEVYSASSRGFAAPAGLSPEVKEKLVSAFEKAINDPEHIKKMNEMGLEIRFMKGDEYQSQLKQDEKTVMDVKWWD